MLKEWRVEGREVEKLVFSPVRWQTWLQVRCLDNTGLYKTTRKATADATSNRQNREGAIR